MAYEPFFVCYHVNMSYLNILFLLFLSALLIEWRFHIHLYRSRRERIMIGIFFFIIGVLWDTYAIKNGHWSFPSENNLGIKIGVMPLEEYVFILIFPFWVITVYKLFHEKLKLRWLR